MIPEDFPTETIRFVSKYEKQGVMAFGLKPWTEKLKINIAFETTSISITKNWQMPKDSIALELYRQTPAQLKAKEYERVEADYSTPPVTEGKNVIYTFAGMPKYDKNGEELIYSVREVKDSRYYTTYSNVGDFKGYKGYAYNMGTITNEKPTEITYVRVRKVWTGMSDGETTPEIKLTLYQNGKATRYKPTYQGRHVFVQGTGGLSLLRCGGAGQRLCGDLFQSG